MWGHFRRLDWVRRFWRRALQLQDGRWHRCAVLWIPPGTETRPRCSHSLPSLYFPSLPPSFSLTLPLSRLTVYTYLSSTSISSLSISLRDTSATTAQRMASLRPENPVSVPAHLFVFLLTASAWMPLPGPVRCDSGALNRRGGEDRTFDMGGGEGGSPPGLPTDGDQDAVGAESSPRFRRALSREKQMSLLSSSFVLKGDATHNQAMVHWTGENSSVSSLPPPRPVPSRPAGSYTITTTPLFVTFHHPSLQPQRTSCETSYCSRRRLPLQTHAARLPERRRRGVVFTHPGGPAGRAVDVVRHRALLKEQDFLNDFMSGGPQIDTMSPQTSITSHGGPCSRASCCCLLTLRCAGDHSVHTETSQYLCPLFQPPFTLNYSKMNTSHLTRATP